MTLGRLSPGGETKCVRGPSVQGVCRSFGLWRKLSACRVETLLDACVSVWEKAHSGRAEAYFCGCRLALSYVGATEIGSNLRSASDR